MQNRIRQRQKNSQKYIIIVGISTVMLVAIGLTLYFNFSNSKNAHAKDSHQPVEIMVTDQELVNDFSIASPVIISKPKPGVSTIHIRKLKPENLSAISN